MAPRAQLPFLLVTASAWLLLTVSSRPGALSLDAGRSGARDLLQDDQPCLFINGRFIPPCPQLDQTPSPPEEVPDTSPSPTSPTPPTETPTDPPSSPGENVSIGITDLIAECRFNGSLGAPLSAIEACKKVEEECDPQVVTPFSGGNETVPASLVNKIVEQACRTEAIASCSQMAFSTVPEGCKTLLEMGPPTPNEVCPGIREANEIFESSVSVYCEQEFTPEEEGN